MVCISSLALTSEPILIACRFLQLVQQCLRRARHNLCRMHIFLACVHLGGSSMVMIYYWHSIWRTIPPLLNYTTCNCDVKRSTDLGWLFFCPLNNIGRQFIFCFSKCIARHLLFSSYWLSVLILIFAVISFIRHILSAFAQLPAQHFHSLKNDRLIVFW